MKSLSWAQANTWRLQQHSLSPRLPRQDFLLAAMQTGGLQAQVMSAAEMGLCTRVEELTRVDVQNALWSERTLIKTWAMRATLHLIAASDLPLYVAARSVDHRRNWKGYFGFYGISPKTQEIYLNAGPQILTDQPMTREDFTHAVLKQTGSQGLFDLLQDKGWGTPLKPLAWSGDLCFGPNQGRNGTFVNPRRWIGDWQPLEPYPALQEVCQRYFRAYGPATIEDFATWWELHLTCARKLFSTLADEFEMVNIEGWKALALRSTLEAMQNTAGSHSVILLPLFDAYVMGIGRGIEIEPLLPKAWQKWVYRPQGWISAVVLEDGVMRGVWESEERHGETVMKVHLFSPPSNDIKVGIEAEAERLRTFLNSRIVVEYVNA